MSKKDYSTATTAAGPFLEDGRRPGKVKLEMSTTVEEIRGDTVLLKNPDGFVKAIPNDVVFLMIGRELPLGVVPTACIGHAIDKEHPGGPKGFIDATIEVTLPAVFSCQRDLAEEKYPKLKDILKAKKKKVATFDFSWPAQACDLATLSPPPDPVAGKIVGEGPDAVPELLKLLQDEAKALSF